MKQYLTEEVYNRLCTCRTTKRDLQEIVNAKWRVYLDKGKDKERFTKEDALIAVLELLDCNGLDFELTKDEYNELWK